jgi:hypothetical protein
MMAVYHDRDRLYARQSALSSFTRPGLGILPSPNHCRSLGFEEALLSWSLRFRCSVAAVFFYSGFGVGSG